VAACPMVRAPGCVDDAVAEPDVASNHKEKRLMRRHPYASAMLASEGPNALAPVVTLADGSPDIGLPVTDNETKTSSAPG